MSLNPARLLAGSIVAAVLFSSVLLPAFAQAQPDTQCRACRKDQVGQCKTACRNSINESTRKRCIGQCLTSRCGAICEAEKKAASAAKPLPSRSSSSSSDRRQQAKPANECNSCIKRAETKDCVSQCDPGKVSDIYACRRKCAKRRCANSCQLPVRPSDEQEKKYTPRDCDLCRRIGRSYCGDKCGPDPERAGYTACYVSCIEERCLEKCNPNLF